jgi:predicted metalloprotease
MTRVPHPVYCPYLSPCDFCFFGYVKKQMKDQTIMSKDNVEGALTAASEKVRRDRLQSRGS